MAELTPAEKQEIVELFEPITLCGRFAKHSVSTGAVSIINRKRTLDPTSDIETITAGITAKHCRIHHSVQGIQCLFSDYISTLTCYRIEISLTHRGCPWENDYAERLIPTLKEEEVYLNDYEDKTDDKTCIGHFIQQVYNQKRPHSTLDYLIPIEFEQKNLS